MTCWICDSEDVHVVVAREWPDYDTLGCYDCGAVGTENDFADTTGWVNEPPGDHAARDSM